MVCFESRFSCGAASETRFSPGPGGQHGGLPLWALRAVLFLGHRCALVLTRLPSLGALSLPWAYAVRGGLRSSELRNEWFYQVLEGPSSAIPWGGGGGVERAEGNLGLSFCTSPVQKPAAWGA